MGRKVNINHSEEGALDFGQNQTYSSRSSACKNMKIFQALILVIAVTFCYGTYEYNKCSWTGDRKSYEEGDVYFNKAKCTNYECQDGQWVKDDVGCHNHGECRKKDATWQHDCITYKCLIIGSGKAHIQTLKTRCRWADDKCYEVGHEKVKDCDTYVCQKSGGEYKFVLRERGCEKVGEKLKECAKIGETWGSKMDCLTYTCKRDRSPQGISTTRIVKTEGCRWKGECYKEKETATLDRCNLLRCKKAYGQFVMKFESRGCNFNNRCRDRGSNWHSKCVEYECPHQKSTKNYKYVVIFNGCPDSKGICRKYGESWWQFNSYSKVCTAIRCGENGLVKSDKGNCYHGGKCYSKGVKVPSDGNTCRCINGKVVCLKYR